MTDNTDDKIWSSIDTSSLGGFTYANKEKAQARGRTLFSRRGDSSDEIDPRKLVRDPTLSELRWYYRRTFAKTIVDKPIDDAFKHGFEITGPDMNTALKRLKETDYINNYKLAHQKARRDGFALLMLQMRDTSAGIHVSPRDEDVMVLDITGTKVLTVDDLCRCAEGEILPEIEEAFGLSREQYRVRETGIVINIDPNSPDFREPLGYVVDLGQLVEGSNVRFLHRDRVQHFTWNQQVDGDFKEDRTVFGAAHLDNRRFRDDRPLGEYEGDSVLVQSYDLFKGIAKGNWAIMQALFRNAANLYTVELPEDADDEEFAAAMREFSNMNAKSEYITPHGYEVTQHASGDMLDPRPHFDVMFDQILASHEMTRSVLFGTQAGVVSGSETDIKNYFNKVERFRQNRGKDEIMWFLNYTKFLLDGRVKDAEMNIEFEWGPLFKLSREDEFRLFMTDAQSVTTLLNGYVLTPDEARSILSQAWSRIDLEDLTEDQMDILDRINLTQVGAWQGAERNEPDVPQDNPFTGQNGGGNRQGNQQTNIRGDNADAMIDAIADKVIERVMEKLEE